MARGYTESFHVYGERKSFEWQQLESEKPVLFSMAFDPNAEHVMNDYGRGGLVTEERIDVPDYADRLPEEIGRFTRQTVYDASNPHLAFLQAAATGAPTPTWSTSSSAASWRTGTRSPATSTAPIGPAWHLRPPVRHGGRRGKAGAGVRISTAPRPLQEKDSRVTLRGRHGCFFRSCAARGPALA